MRHRSWRGCDAGTASFFMLPRYAGQGPRLLPDVVMIFTI